MSWHIAPLGSRPNRNSFMAEPRQKYKRTAVSQSSTCLSRSNSRQTDIFREELAAESESARIDRAMARSDLQSASSLVKNLQACSSSSKSTIPDNALPILNPIAALSFSRSDCETNPFSSSIHLIRCPGRYPRQWLAAARAASHRAIESGWLVNAHMASPSAGFGGVIASM